MRPRVLAVVLIGLALAATLLYVPVRRRILLTDYAHEEDAPGASARYTWIWRRTTAAAHAKAMGFSVKGVREEERILWWVVAGEQALVVLLGGGLLTWVVRRDRRRRSEAAG